MLVTATVGNTEVARPLASIYLSVVLTIGISLSEVNVMSMFAV
jgi:hypothetical protein